MTCEELLEQGWNDHGDRPDVVAQRLRDHVALADTPPRVAAFARLATHVYGEHLARWEDGVALLRRLLDVAAADADALRVVQRSMAALRHAMGDAGALESLDAEDRTAALATVAAAYVGQSRHGEALRTYAQARASAPAALPARSPATRALAVAGNNLAAALEEKADRTPEESAGMVDAAAAALHYWQQSGTWLEHERALYRLSCSHRAAGDAGEAVRRARQCIEVCEANDAPALERFFAWAVLARAQGAAGQDAAYATAQAHAQYDAVAEDERRWCEDERQALAASTAAPGLAQ